MRELLKEKLQQLGFPSNEYSLHSLRAGGVTVAAMAGIPDRVFKRHGWWKSDNAKDGYVEDSMDKRLSVSWGCDVSVSLMCSKFIGTCVWVCWGGSEIYLLLPKKPAFFASLECKL